MRIFSEIGVIREPTRTPHSSCPFVLMDSTTLTTMLSCKFIAVCEDFSDSHLQIMPRQGYPLNTRLRASPATARQARNDAKEEEISGTTPAFAKASAFAEAMA